MQFFLGTGGSATIKHRCVTHLYGRNFSGRLTVGSGKLDISGYSQFNKHFQFIATSALGLLYC